MRLNVSLSIEDAIEGHLDKLQGNSSELTLPTDRPTGQSPAVLGGGVGGAVVFCLLMAAGIEWLRRAGLLQPLVDWVRASLTHSTNRLRRENRPAPPPPPPIRIAGNLTDEEREQRRVMILAHLAERAQSPHLYSNPNCTWI